MQCWTPEGPAVAANPSLLFSRCVICPGSTSDKYILEQINPPSRDVFEVDPSSVFNANSEEDELAMPDIGMLSHKNVACVLSMLKTRYQARKIYTLAEPLLVAINPFEDLGNTTQKWIDYYRTAPNCLETEPHVFRTARQALSNMEEYNRSQTIVVSGESGAGKTEATKQVMRYFAACSTGDNRIQEAIMAGNPLLEAFGNAKTIRNNNSSRFGRFMQLSISSSEGIMHGAISNFLLEKVRLVSQEPNERSFHIFYQLLKGADAGMRQQYHLRNLEDYAFLTARSGGCFDIPGVDDREDFQELRQSFASMGLSQEDESTVFSILSGCLLIGNAKVTSHEMQGVPDAAFVSAESLAAIKEAADLLFVNSSALVEHILQKQTKIGNQVLQGPRTFREADMMIKSVAKHVYDQLFAWLVRFLNKAIAPDGEFGVFMGMLDIFGFEVFEQNSLEQLLINITNEHLQKHFIDIVFEIETKLYQSEGVPTEALVWTDNVRIMETLCGSRDSVFAIIEDTCLGLRATDEALCSMIVRKLANRGIVLPSRKDQRMKFVVRHTIADIEYSCDGFLEKNQDFLKRELLDTLKASHNPIMAQMFEGVIVEAGKIGKGSLIASQFLRSLNSMIGIIRETEPHFIRCLKPNETKRPLEWDAPKVLNQLFSLSILEALQLRQVGYSYRRRFDEFVKRFRWLDLGAAKSDADRRDVAEKILEECGLSREGWVIGKTMVFLKAETARALEILQIEKMVSFRPIVDFVQSAWKRILLKRNLQAIMPLLIRAESHCRRHLAVREHGELDLSPGFTEALLQGIDSVQQLKDERQRQREAQLQQQQEKRPSKKLTKEERLAQKVLQMYKSWDSMRGVQMTHGGFFPSELDYMKQKQSRPSTEGHLRETALSHVSPQDSFQDPGISYHIWRNIESLYQAPLTDHRLQNICTCVRDDMDRLYGHFWQVLVNRTDRFGLATAHVKGKRYLAKQHGVCKDGRVFSFNNIIFTCTKPSRKEIRLHEEAAEKSYLCCRKQDFSGLVRARKSLVPPYMLQDVSYVIGYLFHRFRDRKDWTGFAERLQSYLLGRYSDPHGGSWNVLVQEGSFLVTRLWAKHNRFFRVEVEDPQEEDIDSSRRCCITVMCFEACTVSQS
ncbi:myosin-B/C [Cyclospora cayetanensis]|uniref:Myosin-B/C n=1 Tax=Cyclospora cayetanensis TaxID=88456 RepID=A0A6P6S2F8_9EIME|nr:myosin-B/C [Cyclospora cayetanensis]